MAPQKPIFQSRPYSILISLVVSALLLASCSAPAPAPTPLAPSPTPLVPQVGLPTPTSIPPSPTPQVVMASPTAVPPSPTPLMVLDTPTVIPTSAPLLALPSPAPTFSSGAGGSSMGGNFSLLAGTTAGVIQGTVQPGQVLTYTLSAGQAQPLTLIINSPNNDVTLGFFESNGTILLDPASRYMRWQMVLPITDLYTIRVTGGATTENFTLTVKLPLVVNFASGTSSTTLSGTTVNGYLFSYALNCAAGQTMSAALNVPTSTATIDIYGISSGTLVDASAGYNSWSGVLPQTQDYIIEVVPYNNQVVNYGLTVSCTGTLGSPYYPPENPYAPPASNSYPGQLFFAPGQTEAVVQGTIQPGQVVTYTAQAQQYQPMILIVSSLTRMCPWGCSIRMAIRCSIRATCIRTGSGHCPRPDCTPST